MGHTLEVFSNCEVRWGEVCDCYREHCCSCRPLQWQMSRWRVHVSHGRSHSHQYQSIFRQWQVDSSLCMAQTHNPSAAGSLCALPLCDRWRWFSNWGRVGRWSPGACPAARGAWWIDSFVTESTSVQTIQTQCYSRFQSDWLSSAWRVSLVILTASLLCVPIM